MSGGLELASRHSEAERGGELTELAIIGRSESSEAWRAIGETR